MTDNIYKMIAAESVQEQIIQRSKFLGYALPVKDRQSAREYISSIDKQHPRANHCCWAYLVGYPDTPEEYYSDDGEPSGTAGAPILAAIKHSEVKNIAIAVIRYFGGVKLGVRGLIDAYRSTALLSIEAAKIIECQPLVHCKIICDYAQFESLKYFLEKNAGIIESSSFTDRVSSELYLPKINFSQFTENCQSRNIKISESFEI